jgi:hypothetical protein
VRELSAPFLHANIDRIAAEPEFAVNGETLDKLHRISAATVDRLLRPVKAARLKGRQAAPGRCHTTRRPSSLF